MENLERVTVATIRSPEPDRLFNDIECFCLPNAGAHLRLEADATQERTL